MSKKDQTAAKRPEDMTAYERWELPNLKAGGEVDMRPPTASDLEKIREQAYQEGFQQGRNEGQEKGKIEGLELGLKEGKEQGLSQGLNHADVQISEVKKSLESIFNQLLKPLELEQEKLEQVMLNVILAVTRAVIHTEINTRSDIIEASLQKALQSLPKHANSLLIRLNPEDLESVQSIVSGLSPDTTIQSDVSVARGGCVIESSDQLIDYTIEKRFQKSVQAMLFNASTASDGEVLNESPQELQSHTDFSRAMLDEEHQEQKGEGEGDDLSS